LNILFFIPTFNDQKGLALMVSSLLDEFQQASVLVVDDGSTPAIYLDLSEQHQIKRAYLIRLATNEGLGLATSIALDFMLDNDFDCLVRLDADGQHPQIEIYGLKEKISFNLADVVWGERINHHNLKSSKALIGSATKILTSKMGKIIFRSDVQDWFTGFFAINRAAAMAAQNVHLERYCEVQLLCIFHAAQFRIVTHPIEQLDREHGVSSIGWIGGMMIMLRSSFMMLLFALRMHPK
jgi:glycosyltransferase involved in cell wall biosynthesis